MQSELLTVSEYMTSIPNERKQALNKIRQLCLQYLTGYEETMHYKMPTYLKNGISEVAFNSQKNYISLYIMKDVLEKYRPQLKDCGKGCIRYKNISSIDFELIGNILSDVYNLNNPVCP